MTDDAHSDAPAGAGTEAGTDPLHEALELETLLLGRHTYPTRQPDQPERLERSGYVLLSRMRVQGPMSIGELSEALGLDVSTLNRQTAALTKQGMLERVADPDGGLARKFRMTSLGEACLERDRLRNARGLGTILGDWDREDVATFVEMLRKFNGSIEMHLGRPWPRQD